MRGWTIGLVIMGVLVIVLGFFMLTLQVCFAAVVTPEGPECIRWGSAFLFSGSFTIFMGFMMLVSGGYQAYAEM